MATIQKRADELKPGDVLAPAPGRSSVVVQTRDVGGACVEVLSVAIVGGEAQIDRTRQRSHLHINVESPDLTPAQQHADDLAQALKIAVAALNGKDAADVDAMQDLLDKIKPPEPPTLAEALEALIRWQNSYGTHGEIQTRKDTDHLIDRARRAKVI